MYTAVQLLLITCAVLSGARAAYVTEPELTTVMTQLWNGDSNGVSQVSLGLNLQGRASSNDRDNAPNRLFGSGISSAMSRTTYASFIALVNNYISGQGQREDFSSSERREVNTFISNVLNTGVGRTLSDFLIKKGLASSRSGVGSVLYNLWFWQYSRARGVWDSSGFEHVFLGEIKTNKNDVSGLHNWIRFYLLEKSGDVDYQGYYNYKKPGLLKLRMLWGRALKPVTSMFVGTSPELDLSIYTICALVRPNGYCRFKVNNVPISVQTYLMTYFKDKAVIGSAYPVA